MQNILFTPPNDEKILSGVKSLTARNWKRKPPAVGSHCTASTGYAKETRFAVIRILDVMEWDGHMDGINAELVTGMSRQEIAEREGYGFLSSDNDMLTDWDYFIAAYHGHNAENFKDKKRKNYFIRFQLIQRLVDGGQWYCTRCEVQDKPESFYNWTFSKSPICDKCLGEDYREQHYSGGPRAGYE